ncbi:hypothetical protein PtA15_4A446 [Puccinia triticina]|uniref:Uncharacterized protein n=1 Tax=Puccinia triticina TaxID=208348 RepID=A0ABY7CFX8_9BASI|nr:uncharacterized protein PtA15_4A446 [Puccinia triticina]WAQ83995.1 hypothetical protein PtA15_4A446 [Puccinia triticina]
MSNLLSLPMLIIVNPWALHVILPVLLNQIATTGEWQLKTGALNVLDVLVINAADQMFKAMPKIKVACTSLTKSCALFSNKEIENFIPALISALINPVKETLELSLVDLLAAVHSKGSKNLGQKIIISLPVPKRLHPRVLRAGMGGLLYQNPSVKDAKRDALQLKFTVHL